MADEKTDILQDADKPQKFRFAGEPWAHQKDAGESLKAYAAFVEYRDMGPKRSLAKLGLKLGKTKTHLEGWSSRWQWIRRIEEWDREEERLYQIELREQRKKMAERHAKQGALLQTAALNAMKKNFGENFEKLTPALMKSGDILRYFTEGAKLERTALGAPTEIIEQQHTGGAPENDRKPFVPLTHAGRIDDALALLEAARARAADGAVGAAD